MDSPEMPTAAKEGRKEQEGKWVFLEKHSRNIRSEEGLDLRPTSKKLCEDGRLRRMRETSLTADDVRAEGHD